MDYQLAINILSKKMGVLLRTARTQRGESKKTCGEVIGVTSRTINKYEIGEKSPSLPELEVLAYYLDVPLEYLMFGERKNTEWEDAVRHLRRFVEEVIEAKVNMWLQEMGLKKAGTSGRERGVLSQ